MELRHLRYFVAVAEQQSFTRAAEKLFIAQPPLSRQIQQLEEELGVQLFERGSRPLKLTEAGQFFYGHAQQLLAKAADLKSMTQRISHVEQNLVAGFVASTLYGMLPRIIYSWRQQYPDIPITLHEMSTTEQISALKEGRIDVGFGRLRIEDSLVRRIILRTEKLVVALPPGHRLAGSVEALNLADVVDEPLIIFPNKPRPSFADQVLSIFADRSLKPERIIEVRELQIALGLVAAGEGISIVPNSLYGMLRNDIHFMPLNDPNAVSPIIMSMRQHDHSENLHKLLEIIYSLYDKAGIAYTRENV
ncbi:LysR family transcriptional regulator [Uruburuella testudinis]|uniref:LysR family transcriptional regulator n=1 Tax=Uruburuella testudinis TaxID=1282863 RepID=A0ABY4DPD2_9NEIS|nr:LysR family transcriptional regulator [Uruburuella testudinis]UOO80914.1 LysR family transcriptional regulator [Uruburuella testudinis]